MPGRTPKYHADVLMHTWQILHTKSPPGVQDVMPPADTVVDQSGTEVEWHSISKWQVSHEHTEWHAYVALIKVTDTAQLLVYPLVTHKFCSNHKEETHLHLPPRSVTKTITNCSTVCDLWTPRKLLIRIKPQDRQLSKKVFQSLIKWKQGHYIITVTRF